MATHLFIYWCCNQCISLAILIFPNGKFLVWGRLFWLFVSVSNTHSFPQLIKNESVFDFPRPFWIVLFSGENHSNYRDQAFKCVLCKKKFSSTGKNLHLMCRQKCKNIIMICKYHRYIWRRSVVCGPAIKNLIQWWYIDQRLEATYLGLGGVYGGGVIQWTELYGG